MSGKNHNHKYKYLFKNRNNINNFTILAIKIIKNTTFPSILLYLCLS